MDWTLLQQLGEELHDVPAIIITGNGSEERAVAAIESGAFWYIEKPLQGGPCCVPCSIAPSARLATASGRRRCTRQLREAGRLGELVGESKPMQDVMRVVEHGRAQFRFGADHRRNRLRQGNRRAHDSPAVPAR